MANKKKEIKKAKKNKNIVGKTPAHYNEDAVKMVKIGVIVLLCFVVIYLVTAIINGELFGKKTTPTETEIQKVEILMGETFEKNDSEYIIVYYDFKDSNYSGLYNSLVSNYTSSGKEVPMYKVDLSTNFSKKYMTKEGEVSNTAPTSLANLKISGSTLIRIKDKQVVTYLEGKDNIKSYIEELVK